MLGSYILDSQVYEVMTGWRQHIRSLIGAMLYLRLASLGIYFTFKIEMLEPVDQGPLPVSNTPAHPGVCGNAVIVICVVSIRE